MRFLFAFLIPAALLAQVSQSPIVDGMMRAVTMAGQIKRTQIEERRLALREEQLRMEAEDRRFLREQQVNEAILRWAERHPDRLKYEAGIRKWNGLFSPAPGVSRDDFLDGIYVAAKLLTLKLEEIKEGPFNQVNNLTEAELNAAMDALQLRHADVPDYWGEIAELLETYHMGNTSAEQYFEGLYTLAKYGNDPVLSAETREPEAVPDRTPAPPIPVVDFTQSARVPYHEEAYRVPSRPFAWAQTRQSEMKASRSRTNRLLEDIDYDLFMMRMDRETDRSLQMLRDWTMPSYGSQSRTSPSRIRVWKPVTQWGDTGTPFTDYNIDTLLGGTMSVQEVFPTIELPRIYSVDDVGFGKLSIMPLFP